ncbi:MAG: hypothetical protein IPO32_14570 [Crocinitomicaceae bacterium]|nr:hypothetical protein [Crocinitomicaceae bacterium]
MISETNTPPTPGQRFWRLLAPDRKEITNIYIYAVFNGLVYLSLPLGIQAIINLIQGGRISTSWVLLVSFVIAGIAAMGVLQILQLRITEVLQQKYLPALPLNLLTGCRASNWKLCIDIMHQN